MLILGIETSCDETAAAVIEAHRQRLTVRSDIISSQISLHRKTGGIVPEVAAREHVVKIIPVIQEALAKAKKRLEDIDLIAVTQGPGLLSSLVIGTNAAVTLSWLLRKPLIPVNHIEGHMYSNWLNRPPCQFPIIVLTASGGHNELVLWKNHGQYRFLGATCDDAAGEAFDKVARLLGLPYPGGPAIAKEAKEGNRNRFSFPRAWLKPWDPLHNKLNFDFSFAGLKTALLHFVKSQKQKKNHFLADTAASFQEAVCDVLSEKLMQAAKRFHVNEIHLAGGVSANLRLREMVREKMKRDYLDLPLRYPREFLFCTDNAAMIAAAGSFRYQKNPEYFQRWKTLEANPNLPVRNW